MVPVTDFHNARRLLPIAAGITAAYALSARLGFQVAFLAEQVTTVWAPTGIAIAALLLWGGRLWPAIWLGAFIANSGSGAPLWTAAVIAAGNTLEAVAAVWMLRRAPFDPGLRRLADTSRFIILGALLATTVSATIGVTTLCVASVQAWPRFSELWLAWWLGDVLGALVVAPVLLTAVRAMRVRVRRPWAATALLVLVSITVAELVFGGIGAPTFGQRPFHYILFPLVIVAAVRFGQPATALVVLAISAVTIVNTVLGTGPFASPQIHEGLLLLPAFMAVLSSTGLLLAAAMAERLTGQRRRGAAHVVGEVLADAGDLPRAALAILQTICQHLGWQIGALWLVDEEVDQLRCHAVWSYDSTRAAAFEEATRQTLFPPGAGLPGRVWTSRQAVWIEDVVEDRNFKRVSAAKEAGVHGAFCFPIRLGGEVLGVVEFFTHRVAAPDPDLLDTMSTVGNQIGQFIGRKRVERAMLDEQKHTRAILDSALDAVIAMDHRGVITSFNPAAERAFGYRQHDAIGRELADLLIPPDLRDQHRVGLARHLATGDGPMLNRRVETRGFHADGHEFPIEVAIIRISDDGPPKFTGFVRDLTARKQAEDAVRASEERFRSLAASNTALTLYEQDRDLRYRWVFPQHPEFPDYNIGKTDDELLPPGEGERLSRIKQSVLDTGVGRREEITITLPTGSRSYDLMVEPRRDDRGAIVGVSGVALDITERNWTQVLLRESEGRLREADRRKDEFLAMLAHELRNPLAPIRTGLQLVRLAGDSPEAVEQVRAMMERQVGHMVRLIDDLLDVSRITSGKIHLQKQLAQLADLVSGAVEANRAAIDAAGVELEVHLPEQPCLLFVDPTRLVQVLSNLLNNAAKFTDTGGRIVVCAEVATEGTSAGQLTLSVTDTGIGISEDLLVRVFDLFTQGERRSDRPQAGLGIGLALARRIVEMHDGWLDARSDGPGRGSTFTVRLPVYSGGLDLPTPRRSAVNRSPIKRRALVVDDNVDAAETLASLVRALGGEAETATNGLSGIQRAAAFAPDLIFLDVGMPEMDGYETCRRMRNEPFGKNAVIVAITGWGQERDRQRAVEAGFDTHLTKPADPLVLEHLLATATVASLRGTRIPS